MATDTTRATPTAEDLLRDAMSVVLAGGKSVEGLMEMTSCTTCHVLAQRLADALAEVERLRQRTEAAEAQLETWCVTIEAQRELLAKEMAKSSELQQREAWWRELDDMPVVTYAQMDRYDELRRLLGLEDEK